MVYRIYVEKKEGFDREAKALTADVKEFLGVKGVTEIRIVNRYDAEDIEKPLFDYAVNAVFSNAFCICRSFFLC